MIRRGRIIVVLLFLSIGFSLVAARLVFLQVYKAAEYAKRAQDQQEKRVPIEAHRGTIYDRRGRELAISIDMESVYGVPAQVRHPRELARRLSGILHSNRRDLERKLGGKRQFVWIERKVDPDQAGKIKNLDPREVGLTTESKRFYPKKTLAGPILGFTNIDNEGLEGIERAYDKTLRGTKGWIILEKDARGRAVFPGGPGLHYERKLPKPGHDLILTIDEVIQHIAEKELDAALASSRAKAGVCIVMDPHTAEVLAMTVRSSHSGRPVFNPNEPQRSKPTDWRNRAITDAYEPGSIFKPFLAAAALEERVVDPLEKIDCSEGKIQVADRVIRDAHKSGVLTFTDVIAESSNVGTIQVAQRLGEKRLYQYVTAFGFGRRTGIGIPGEIPGLLKDYHNWSGVSIASIAIGQEIGVTPLQMATAFCALANGGTLMEPYIVSEIVGRNDEEGKKFLPQPAGRVVTEATCAKVNAMLQRVVEEGTGKNAQLDEYTVAGKTGTAQKIDPTTGRYSHKEYIASFAGFVPATAPKLVIVVMIDTPQEAVWGGSVAAPVFKAVAEQSLDYLQIPPDRKGDGMLVVTR